MKTEKELLKSLLQSAVTQYDQKESTKRGYNRNALGIYFQRVEEIASDVESGAEIRAAIVAGFNGRLADHCLRRLNLPITSNQEAQQGAWYYQPVKSSAKL